MKYKLKLAHEKFAIVEIKNDEILIDYEGEIKTFKIGDVDLTGVENLCEYQSQLYAYFNESPIKYSIEKLSHSLEPSEIGGANADGKISSPVSGKLVAIHKKIGDKIENGDLLIELEAMKIIYKINSNCDGILEFIIDENVSFVKESDLIAKISCDKE